MERKRSLFEDYNKLLGLASTSWKDHMLVLLEDDQYNIEVKNAIELPFPMQDGKTQLEPGSYQVELSNDKVNYIWTNPSTQERVVFPVTTINEPEGGELPPEEELAGPAMPGSDVSSQEVNPFAGQDLGFPDPTQPQV